MKKLISMLAVFAMAGLVVLNACKDDEDAPTPLSLAKLMANDKDLNGATPATDVAANAVITTEFSTEVDEATAKDENITLVRTFDGSAVAKDIAVDGKTITITPQDPLFEGDEYKVGFTAGLKSTQGQALTLVERTFKTSGIGLGTAPKASSQYLYVQFGGNVVDLTGNSEEAYSQVAWREDRFGNANSAADFRGATANGNGDIIALEGGDFTSSAFTLSVWVYVNKADYTASETAGGNKALLGLAMINGYFLELGDSKEADGGGIGWFKFGSNHKVNPDPMTHVEGGDWGDTHDMTDGSVKINTLTGTGWHQIVLAHDPATYTKTIYLDGAKVKEWVLTGAEWNMKEMTLSSADGVDNKLALGFWASKENGNPDWAMYKDSKSTFKGGMDDLRLFNVALNATEVGTLYNAEKP